MDGTDTEGRLEVWAFGDWRAVCPSGFDDLDASVACVILGFGYVCARANITIGSMSSFYIHCFSTSFMGHVA